MVPAFMRELAKGNGPCLSSPCGGEISPFGGGSALLVCMQPPGKDGERGKVSVLVMQTALKCAQKALAGTLRRIVLISLFQAVGLLKN